ncbi:hypothetical protein HW932_06110 [Allochromatium humboldtianum]|uniref:Uncharacterized protein n=1 Tax=Allochromatium humboldtianum TaxID=504901 RepID=A0A850RGT9_9GAMM|nr:hypothetical protein [Allochromatium humboldtianum]NVZ08831.1 hypothetical protein [Allochromatium humboldtianum]
MHQTPIKRRGRPSSGAALSGAERQRRYMARLKAGVTDGNTVRAGIRVTDEKGNPEHRRLFIVPSGDISGSTALAVPQLPEARTITGDREVDAMLWLKEVCQTARDVAIVDKALEAAAKIQTPAKAIEDRYTAWLRLQPDLHPLQIAFASIGIADIERHAETARERIAKHAEGMAAFGSYAAAMSATPAERMVFETVGAVLDGEELWRAAPDRLDVLFAGSINPATLSECLAELHYWQWLSNIRWRMSQTEHPGEFQGDDDERISARRWFVEGLLTELAPVDRAEAIHIADGLKGVVDEAERRAEILEHLLRTCP